MRVPAHSARRPTPQDRVQWIPVPAPVAGIDAIHPANAIDPTHALLLLNVIGGDRGLKARPGTAEHATNVGATAGDVRTILPYHSSGALDRLFAAVQNGLYNITAGGAAPTLLITWPTQTANAGYGEPLGFVNSAGAHFLLYTDEANGYYLYTESTDSWAVGSVTGVAPGALVHVTQWGSRVWFTERDSTRAWYLAVGAISGAATAFDFGPHFKHGGTLVGLWAWTRDGGTGGMNDLLVAVSSNGDVVVFGGTDPAFASTFGIVGRWHVGGVPAGRRLATPYGGDLQLLTTSGLLSISRLVQGQTLTPDTYQTDLIRPIITEAMALSSTLKGWHVITHPRGAFLMVNSPSVAGIPQEQFAMSLATRGWSRLRGLDILSSAVWEGELYFGTRDGRVLKSTGAVDNVLLGNNTTQAKAIECWVLSGFSNYGSHRVKFTRGMHMGFLTHGKAPAFQAFVRFDFDLTEPTGTATASLSAAGTWDVAVWDTGVWGGLTGQVYRHVGSSGFGVWVAPGVRFTADDYEVLTTYEIAIEEGRAL